LALYYLDTSALVKLYIREPGTERLLRSRDQRPIATGLIQRFAQHLEAKFLRQSLSEAVLDMACGLIDRHPLRAYDAVQLADCLILRATLVTEQPIFVCADVHLLEAAEAEGLVILNPESQT
jgi:predicted nucleic acid-binding protein